MARIAKRLAGPALVTNSAATVYTAPAATKAVVRHIHVQNPTGSSVSFTLSIGADAAGTRLFDAYVIAAGTVLDHYGAYVLSAAEIIQAVAGTTNVLTLTISGDEIVSD
jgi:O-glycosyl hydrolase